MQERVAEQAAATSGAAGQLEQRQERAGVRAAGGRDLAEQERALEPERQNGVVDPSKITKNIAATPKIVAHKGSGYGYCVPFVKVHTFETDKVGGKLQPNAHVDVSFQVGLKAPPDKVDIASANSQALNPANYAQAVKDLTPDAAGYAPRTRFYAKALTRRHELYHVQDYVSAGGPIIQRAIDSLATRPISAATLPAALNALQNLIRGDLIEYYAGAGRRTAAECREDGDIETYTARPGEGRAFGDGRPHYQALADGIAARFAGGARPDEAGGAE